MGKQISTNENAMEIPQKVLEWTSWRVPTELASPKMERWWKRHRHPESWRIIRKWSNQNLQKHVLMTKCLKIFVGTLTVGHVLAKWQNQSESYIGFFKHDRIARTATPGCSFPPSVAQRANPVKPCWNVAITSHVHQNCLVIVLISLATTLSLTKTQQPVVVALKHWNS